MNNTTTNHTTKSTPAVVIKAQHTDYCCCIRTDGDNNTTFTRTRALATNPINIDKHALHNVLRLSN